MRGAWREGGSSALCAALHEPPPSTVTGHLAPPARCLGSGGRAEASGALAASFLGGAAPAAGGPSARAALRGRGAGAASFLAGARAGGPGRSLPSAFPADPAKWGPPDPPDPAGPGKIVDQRGTTTGKAAEEQIGQTYDAASVNGVDPYEKMLANLPWPCDKMGRITSSPDGHFCQGADACVTSLPEDYGVRSGGPPPGHGDPYCWIYRTPECPPPPPCTKEERWHRDPIWHCPPAPPCPEPYWEDLCKARAGQPWCVAPEFLKSYGGPIEIDCKASGPEAKVKGSPTGCWWQDEFTEKTNGIIRLPGRVANLGPPNEQGDPELSRREAQDWILNGRLPPAAAAAGGSQSGHPEAQVVSS